MRANALELRANGLEFAREHARITSESEREYEDEVLVTATEPEPKQPLGLDPTAGLLLAGAANAEAALERYYDDLARREAIAADELKRKLADSVTDEVKVIAKRLPSAMSRLLSLLGSLGTLAGGLELLLGSSSLNEGEASDGPDVAADLKAAGFVYENGKWKYKPDIGSLLGIGAPVVPEGDLPVALNPGLMPGDAQLGDVQWGQELQPERVKKGDGKKVTVKTADGVVKVRDTFHENDRWKERQISKEYEKPRYRVGWWSAVMDDPDLQNWLWEFYANRAREQERPVEVVPGTDPVAPPTTRPAETPVEVPIDAPDRDLSPDMDYLPDVGGVVKPGPDGTVDWDFEQPDTTTEPQRVRVRNRAELETSRRRRDSKMRGMQLYLAGLRFANKTWGKVSEALEMSQVAERNTLWAGDVILESDGALWLARAGTSLYDVPVRFKYAAVRAMYEGAPYSFDVDQFLLDVVVMEVTDRTYAKLGSLEERILRRHYRPSHPMRNQYGNPTTWANRRFQTGM